MRQPPPPPRPPPNQPQLRLSAASQVTLSPHVAANGTPLSLSLTRLAPLLSTTTHLSFNSRPTVPGPRVDDHLAALFSTELTVWAQTSSTWTGSSRILSAGTQTCHQFTTTTETLLVTTTTEPWTPPPQDGNHLFTARITEVSSQTTFSPLSTATGAHKETTTSRSSLLRDLPPVNTLKNIPKILIWLRLF